jgi:hypothetical protein
MSLDIIETHLIDIISRSNDVVTKQTASKALGELGRLRVYLTSVEQEREKEQEAAAAAKVVERAPSSGTPQPRYTTSSKSERTKKKSAYRVFYEKMVEENATDLKGRELSKHIHQEWIQLSPEEKREYEDN